MNKDFGLIQKYYSFELSEKELAQFKTRVEEDEKFSKLVMSYHKSQKEASNYYQSKEELERKEKWNKLLLKEELLFFKKKNSFIGFKGLAAASILLLVGITSLFYFFSENDNERWSKLLAEGKAMSPDLELTLLRGEVDNQEEKLFKDAHDFYLMEDYDAVIHLLKKVPEHDLHYEDAILLEAISHYRLGEYQHSLNVLNSFEDKVEQEALLLFYKSLNYLEQKEIEKAKEILIQLNTANQKISTKAKQLQQLIYQFQSE